MTNFTNMKIPIEGNLDEIVAELERRGYENYGDLNDCDFIFTTCEGVFIGWANDCEYAEDFIFTCHTLSELKAMK